MEDFVIFGGDDHVVHIDVKPSLCNLFLENVIHHCLKSGQGVGQAEEHHSWFEETFASFEGGFVFIAFLDADVVISPANVELREKAFLCQVVDKFRNKWQWIFVRNCPFVQVPIVLYWMEFAIFLSNQEEATGIRGL